MPRGPSSKDDKRRRGVQASPVKLQRALAASGQKTQSAVAERIADQESLDSAPRGLVNKVFRGESVDPRSIERVARALEVDAWTLYLTSDEPEATNSADVGTLRPNAGDDRQGGHRLRNLLLISTAGALFIVALVALNRPPIELSYDSAPKPRSLQSTVAILPIAGPRSAQITSALSDAVDQIWRVVPAPLADDGVDAQRVLDDNSIDQVIVGRITRSGRWLGLALDLHARNTMQTMWRGEIRLGAAAETIDRLMAEVASVITNGNPGYVRTREVQLSYLEGRTNLDRVRTELNVRRALTAFERTIRADPNFADAYAGLCEALIMDHVRTGDASILDDAGKQCSRALDLDAGSVEGRRAHAYLLRKRGDLDAAEVLFEAVLADEPRNTDAWMELAEVHLTRFKRKESLEGAAMAIDALDQATIADAEFWKVPFTRARVLYFSGQLDAAVEAATRAVDLDANVLALSNLGSFQYCKGDFAAARDAYELARNTDSTSFVGDGQLAVMHYYLRDFEQAVRSFEVALELHAQAGRAEEHRLWGNYAHALRQNGQLATATRAYTKAIRLAEEAENVGDGNPVHSAYLAFYREMLHWMDPEQSQLSPMTIVELDRLRATQDAISKLYLSIIYQLRGFDEIANKLREEGASGCPGFAQSPDFEIASFDKQVP